MNLLITEQHKELKSQKKHKYATTTLFLDCLTLECVTDRLSRNVGNYESTLRNIAEERISHLHRGGNLKSRITYTSKFSLLTPPSMRSSIAGLEPDGTR